MQLSKKFIECLTTTISTARFAGIDSFVIFNNTLSGIDDEKTIFVFSDKLKLVGDEATLSIGFNRLDLLNNRLNMMIKDGNYTLDAVHDTKNNTVSQLLFKSSKLAIEYRCANLSTLKYPKDMNDSMKYYFELDTEVVDNITDSAAAMRNEKILIMCKNGMLSFELSDDTRDKCIIKTDVNVAVYTSDVNGKLVLTSDAANFVFRYPMKKLAILLKRSDTSLIKIGAKGILQTIVEGTPVHLVPQV